MTHIHQVYAFAKDSTHLIASAVPTVDDSEGQCYEWDKKHCILHIARLTGSHQWHADVKMSYEMMCRSWKQCEGMMYQMFSFPPPASCASSQGDTPCDRTGGISVNLDEVSDEAMPFLPTTALSAAVALLPLAHVESVALQEVSDDESRCTRSYRFFLRWGRGYPIDAAESLKGCFAFWQSFLATVAAVVFGETSGSSTSLSSRFTLEQYLERTYKVNSGYDGGKARECSVAVWSEEHLWRLMNALVSVLAVTHASGLHYSGRLSAKHILCFVVSATLGDRLEETHRSIVELDNDRHGDDYLTPYLNTSISSVILPQALIRRSSSPHRTFFVLDVLSNCLVPCGFVSTDDAVSDMARDVAAAGRLLLSVVETCRAALGSAFQVSSEFIFLATRMSESATDTPASVDASKASGIVSALQLTRLQALRLRASTWVYKTIAEEGQRFALRHVAMLRRYEEFYRRREDSIRRAVVQEADTQNSAHAIKQREEMRRAARSQEEALSAIAKDLQTRETLLAERESKLNAFLDLYELTHARLDSLPDSRTGYDALRRQLSLDDRETTSRMSLKDADERKQDTVPISAPSRLNDPLAGPSFLSEPGFSTLPHRKQTSTGNDALATAAGGVSAVLTKGVYCPSQRMRPTPVDNFILSTENATVGLRTEVSPFPPAPDVSPFSHAAEDVPSIVHFFMNMEREDTPGRGGPITTELRRSPPVISSRAALASVPQYFSRASAEDVHDGVEVEVILDDDAHVMNTIESFNTLREGIESAEPPQMQRGRQHPFGSANQTERHFTTDYSDAARTVDQRAACAGPLLTADATVLKSINGKSASVRMIPIECRGGDRYRRASPFESTDHRHGEESPHIPVSRTLGFPTCDEYISVSKAVAPSLPLGNHYDGRGVAWGSEADTKVQHTPRDGERGTRQPAKCSETSRTDREWIQQQYDTLERLRLDFKQSTLAAASAKGGFRSARASPSKPDESERDSQPYHEQQRTPTTHKGLRTESNGSVLSSDRESCGTGDVLKDGGESGTSQQLVELSPPKVHMLPSLRSTSIPGQGASLRESCRDGLERTDAVNDPKRHRSMEGRHAVSGNVACTPHSSVRASHETVNSQFHSSTYHLNGGDYHRSTQLSSRGVTSSRETTSSMYASSRMDKSAELTNSHVGGTDQQRSRRRAVDGINGYPMIRSTSSGNVYDHRARNRGSSFGRLQLSSATFDMSPNSASQGRNATGALTSNPQAVATSTSSSVKSVGLSGMDRSLPDHVDAAARHLLQRLRNNITLHL